MAPPKLARLLLVAAWAYPPRLFGRWAWGVLLAWAGHNPSTQGLDARGPGRRGRRERAQAPGHPGALAAFGAPKAEPRTKNETTPDNPKALEERKRRKPPAPWVPLSRARPGCTDSRGPGRPDRRAHRVMASPSQQRPPSPAANVPWRVCPSSRKQQPPPSPSARPCRLRAQRLLVVLQTPTACPPMGLRRRRLFGCRPSAHRLPAAGGCAVNAFWMPPTRLRHTLRHGQRHSQRHS